MRTVVKLLSIQIKSIVRDPGTLFWSFAFPALLMLALGSIWGGSDGDPQLRLGLVAPADTPLVQQLRRELEKAKQFQITQGTEAAELAALRSGDRHVVLTLAPPKAGSHAPGGSTATVVRAHYDPRAHDTAQLVLAAVRATVTKTERELMRRPPTLVVEEAPLRREGRRPTQVDSFVAAIIAMSIIQAGLATAIALVSDRSSGNSDIFRVTPVSPTHMVTGSVITRVLVSAFQAIVVVLVGLIAFGVEVRGSWSVLLGLVVLGTLTFTAIGSAMAMLTKSVEAIQGLVSLVTLPMLFLSGLFFPIDVLPEFARTAALALPSSYLGDGLRWAVSGATSITSLSSGTTILTGWTLVCFVFSVKFFRWN